VQFIGKCGSGGAGSGRLVKGQFSLCVCVCEFGKGMGVNFKLQVF